MAFIFDAQARRHYDERYSSDETASLRACRPGNN
jgi:hypothetical protein